VNGNTDDNRLFIIYSTVQKFAVVKILFFQILQYKSIPFSICLYRTKYSVVYFAVNTADSVFISIFA